MNPIKLVSQNFYKELSTAAVDWLLGNVGDKIRVETVFTVENSVITSTKKPFTINNKDGYVGSGWLTDKNNRFVNFQVGDSVYYYNYIAGSPVDTGTFTIVEKQDNGAIRLSPAPSSPDGTIDSQGVLSNKTAITSIKYSYNFIENKAASNFISAVDGSEQVLYTVSKLGSDTTPENMLFLGDKTWQSGYATIEGVSAGVSSGIYVTTYKIKHYITIPPFVLFDQIQNQLNGVPHKDFSTTTKCWKFISKIEAAEDFTNPNFLVSTIFDSILGNTGWYNENFDTGKTNYSIDNLEYAKGATVIDSVELSDTETTITFDVLNATDTPFSSNTKFVLGFFKVPADPTEYQGNTRTLDQNFCFDRAYQQVGAAAVNGDNYGGDYQVLKTISATLVNSGKITVTAKVAMSANVLSIFGESSNPQYLLFFTTQEYGLDTDSGLNDLVTLQLDMNTFTVDNTDSGMITIEPAIFIRHPEANPATQGVVPGQLTGGNDPSSLAFTSTLVSPPTSIGMSIIGNADNIGDAIWQGNLDDTLQKLADSINDNTTYGSNPVDNSEGYTASYTAGSYELILSTPSGVYTSYNGKVAVLGVNGGSITITPSFTQTFTGGVEPTVTTLDVYPEDELVACSNFYIESDTRETDEIKLTQLKGQIIAKNGDDSFVLDQFTMILSSVPLTGYTQQFDSQFARSFHVPTGTIRKYIQAKRRNDLDTGTLKYFSLNYPILFRWETWVKKLGVDPDFFDTSKPNNGFNEWWYQYGQLSGWDIYYKITVSATKNGIAQTYTGSQEIIPHDYGSNSDYTVKAVLPFEPETLVTTGANDAVQLVTGGGGSVTINSQVFKTTGTQYINAYKKTLIAAIFTKSSTPADVYVEIGIEVYQQGGWYGKRMYSSKWVFDGDTWFSSVDGDGLVKVNAYGNSIVAQCYLDPSLPNFLQNITNFKLTARIYEVSDGGLESDDGVDITTDDGVQIIVS